MLEYRHPDEIIEEQSVDYTPVTMKVTIVWLPSEEFDVNLLFDGKHIKEGSCWSTLNSAVEDAQEYIEYYNLTAEDRFVVEITRRYKECPFVRTDRNLTVMFPRVPFSELDWSQKQRYGVKDRNEVEEVVWNSREYLEKERE